VRGYHLARSNRDADPNNDEVDAHGSRRLDLASVLDRAVARADGIAT
jgi:hypothetical protein